MKRLIRFLLVKTLLKNMYLSGSDCDIIKSDNGLSLESLKELYDWIITGKEGGI